MSKFFIPQISGAFLSLFVVLVASIASASEPSTTGIMSGGVTHSAPDWFKESFLEIQDDVDDASAANKHVMLFFQLNDCPYCDRMLTESFESEPVSSYIQQHFDVIAINVRGDREIAFNEEINVLEKELSEILQVRATPAILFLNAQNKTVVRANGYRAPERFQKILEYVSSRSYQQGSLADYLDKSLKQNVYQLREHALFQSITDLSKVSGALAVIFEDTSCYDCDEFHDNLLAHEEVQAELKAFTLVRLDANSKATIIDTKGNKTTAGALAKKFGMTYRPGVLIFDEGKLVSRYDSLIYSFHFKEGLRFIGRGIYKNEDYRSYSRRHREELLASGINIDLSK